ncbi:DUF6629 family protein [Gilvimarinus sp. F26214L]|uniref:DUF6629 family protein n=1 Tax=Gilvimarinus sp. DZF01 TaxID=3461371 RepID=UPI0040452311
MCFSATASFTAGAALSVFGAATLRKTRRPADLAFAAIPLLFGVQQIIEGFLWLSFLYERESLNVVTTYAFTVFSHVLWPIFIPLAVGIMEPSVRRRQLIWLFLLMGLAVGFYLLYLIIRFPLTSEVREHIVYVSPHFYELPMMLLYLAATCVSCFFSSYPIVRVFGAAALALFAISIWFYTEAFFSVWCFFAALLSFIIYLHFRSADRAQGRTASTA